MQNKISRIVIVGGGSAGWLCAAVIAAERGAGSKAQNPLDVVLVESPDVPTVGVGEGTWPSMRTTLKRIGLSETDFISECDASFKQGTFFKNWCNDNDEADAYSHPFTVPAGFADINLAPHWLGLEGGPSFADAVTSQTACPSSNKWDWYSRLLVESFVPHGHVTQRIVDNANDASR